MSFDVGADAYGQFMGRYSELLAERFVASLDIRPGQRALDVGCGPGALTAVLVAALDASHVAAVDPSESFVAATRLRLPGVDVRVGRAEALPFADSSVDLTLAQLAVHFMTDASAGIIEMARVTRAGGLVGASVWDHAGGRGPLATFWAAVREQDPDAQDESGLPGVREGQLAELFVQAGLSDVWAGVLSVRVAFDGIADWWAPFTLGVGPAGVHVAALDDAGRAGLRARCAELLPSGPFELEAQAWTAFGRS